jgi:hypothetical protein
VASPGGSEISSCADCSLFLVVLFTGQISRLSTLLFPRPLATLPHTPMRRLQQAVFGFILSLLLVTPAAATFHLNVIQEVFVGPPTDATSAPLTADQRAQYIMLRMTSSGENFVGSTSFRVEDADGNLLGAFGAFAATLPNAGTVGCAYPNCPALLLGTQAADNLFTFSFDQDVDGQTGRVALPLAGGRVCFVLGSSVIDCVAWGNFDCTRSGNCALANGGRTGDLSANGCDLNFGTPASPAGLQYGFALVRTTFNCLSKENSTDFSLAYPRPVNNIGSSNNVDADVDGLIDVLDCEDANTSFRWPVADRQNLTAATGPPTALSYSQAAASGSGVTYDLVRGTIAHLAGFTDAVCLLNNDPTGSDQDGNDPPVGEGFYYLVRANSTVACGGSSSYGPGTSPALDAVCPP